MIVLWTNGDCSSSGHNKNLSTENGNGKIDVIYLTVDHLGDILVSCSCLFGKRPTKYTRHILKERLTTHTSRQPFEPPCHCVSFGGGLLCQGHDFLRADGPVVNANIID